MSSHEAFAALVSGGALAVWGATTTVGRPLLGKAWTRPPVAERRRVPRAAPSPIVPVTPERGRRVGEGRGSRKELPSGSWVSRSRPAAVLVPRPGGIGLAGRY
jgi:hypothetical protein